ncbi:MAG: hypothetical protein HY720_26535 [Planctomycetes bacterium]|nr:hypothetical protein [Planctomycetota bacterium]
MEELGMRVSAALDALLEDPGRSTWDTKRWTDHVKSAVVGLAREAGQRAYASGDCGAYGREWLYDLSWLDYSPGEKRLSRTVLVMESEWAWDKRERDRDFLKLLVARADLRVMVFPAQDAAKWQSTVDWFVDLIQACQQSQPGDRYLFAGWRTDIKRFQHRHYVHASPASPPP